MFLLFIFSNHVHAITINGSDTTTKNSSSQYTASGCNGTVTWGVTNPGASMNQSALTTSGACGNVLVAARCSADGEIATKSVRVTDGGDWVEISCVDKTCPSCSGTGPTQYNKEVIGVEGIYFRTSWCAEEKHWGNVGWCYKISGNQRSSWGPCSYNEGKYICGSSCTELEFPGGMYAANSISCPDQSNCPGLMHPRPAYVRVEEWRCPSSSCAYNITPQAQEVCGDLKDNNCNGQVDEGCPVCVDNDGDGHYAISASCPQGDDCNDNDNSIYPGAPEICDGKDNNCNGQIDEGFNVGAFCTVGVGACQRTGTKVCSADKLSTVCNATPGTPSPEICDGKDNDCNGEIDEGLSTDADGDGHYTSDSCKEPRDDCNDNNATTYPGAEEICGDGIDNNCDGNKDEGCAVDNDGDGYFASPEGNDPDDNDKDTYPGAPEICDGKDNNGDGNTDEGCCDVEASISPQWVAPQKTGFAPGVDTADITVRLNKPAPSSGCAIDLKVYPVPYSGGHDHHDALRPHGSLDKSSLYFCEGDTGPEKIKFTSSEVAGTEKIELTERGTGKKIELSIDVKVPSLGILGSSSEWRLTGSYGEPGVNSRHYNNHYGEAYTIDAMMAIASDYLEETKTTLGINDMSLERGGLFDVNNNWSSVPGHSLHRKGTSVDISRYVYNAKTKKTSLINCLDDDDLRDIARENFGYLHCESGGRKHIEFSICDLNVKGVKELCGRK